MLLIVLFAAQILSRILWDECHGLQQNINKKASLVKTFGTLLFINEFLLRSY